MVAGVCAFCHPLLEGWWAAGASDAAAQCMKELPAAMLSARRLDSFGTALRARVLDRTAGFSKRYLREFVSEIRFDGKRVVMRGKKAALLAAAAQKEMGTTGVPRFELKWLLALGSNHSSKSRFSVTSAPD